MYADPIDSVRVYIISRSCLTGVSAGASGSELGRGRGWPQTWAEMSNQSCAVALPWVCDGKESGTYNSQKYG